MATWLPGYKVQNWGTSGGSWTRQPCIITPHSTETGGFPSYDNGTKAPHFTISPETKEKRQHVPLDRASRALAHPAGTPQTNRAGTVQIEIVGTCDKRYRDKYGYLYVPDMTDDQYQFVADVCADIIAVIPAVKVQSSVVYTSYPASYGVNARQRLSDPRFASYVGLAAHQHIPDNSHGDCGDIDINKLLSMIKGGSGGSGGSEGFLMALSDAQQKQMYEWMSQMQQSILVGAVDQRTDYVANKVGIGNLNGRTAYLANDFAPAVLAALDELTPDTMQVAATAGAPPDDVDESPEK